MSYASTIGNRSIADAIIAQVNGPKKVHTLIVSDVHLGSRVSRCTDLLELLRGYQINQHKYLFDRLILLGDIFDGLNFKRLKKHAWELVGLLRQITDEESNAEVVWILGNHDMHWAELMEHMVGINVYREYNWTVAGRRFMAMHGDRFDKWVMKYPALATIPCWIYEVIQHLDGHQQRFSRFVKEKSKVWLRINEEVARGMINYVRRRHNKVNAIFCGHTHLAEETYYEEDDVWYYNTGCWTGKQSPTYATISHSGEVLINEYSTVSIPNFI